LSHVNAPGPQLDQRIEAPWEDTSMVDDTSPQLARSQLVVREWVLRLMRENPKAGLAEIIGLAQEEAADERRGKPGDEFDPDREDFIRGCIGLSVTDAYNDIRKHKLGPRR
jgi:hypothetical protein